MEVRDAVETRHAAYLQTAGGAISRGQYANAVQYALRAAAAPRDEQHIRCEAYMVLAMAALELNMPEDALMFAIGAHLTACWAHDPVREEKAASLVALVCAQHPELGEEVVSEGVH